MVRLGVVSTRSQGETPIETQGWSTQNNDRKDK
jgi:hypothetical protein